MENFVSVTCTNDGDSNCNTLCENGRYMDSARLCPSCTLIPNCRSGQLHCTSSSDQVCGQCDDGYYLTSASSVCSQCPPNSWCDGYSIYDCWQPDNGTYSYCPDYGTTSSGRLFQCPNTSNYGYRCEGEVVCLGAHGTCDQDSCWSLRGDGTCTACYKDKAGQGCEHNVCRYVTKSA